MESNFLTVKNFFQISYILLPFVTVFVLGCFKNHISIKKTSNIFFILSFIAALFLNFVSNCDFYFFNIHFEISRLHTIYLAVVSGGFLILSLISKYFVKHSQKIFYASLILLHQITTLFIVCDTIYFSLLLIFWLILLKYLISEISLKENEDKNLAKKVCKVDLFLYFAAIFCIGFDFLRYFVIENVQFEYSSILNSFSRIDDVSILLAFVGFLILIFSGFNFTLLIKQNRKLNSKLHLYNNLIFTFVNTIMALFLLYRVYLPFEYLFSQYQNQICVILMLVLIYFGFLAFKNTKVSDIFSSVYILSVIFGIAPIFAFDDSGLIVSLNYFIPFVFALFILYLLFGYFEEKFKTKDVSDYKKIIDKTKTIQTYILLSLAVFSKMPVSSLFLYLFIAFMSVFSIEYNSLTMNLFPIILVVGYLLSIVALYSLASKILIEPHENSNEKLILPKSLNSILIFLFAMLVLLIFSFKYLYSEFNFYFNIRNF